MLEIMLEARRFSGMLYTSPLLQTYLFRFCLYVFQLVLW